jgi:tetrapyrrole methylase family protein/MazG family protein
VSTITVVGLGPAGPELCTVGTTAHLSGAVPVHLRTTRHPAASLAPAATSFDHVYDHAERLDDVYPAIVELLVAAADEHGHIVYAVPGSPVVAEHTVELLVADPRVEVTIEPALSFVDLTWARLGVDPVALGARIVDGHRFAVEAAGERGPLLVAQCDTPQVLSEVKLALGEAFDRMPLAASASFTVTVLQRLGLDDEQIIEVAWDDLDRVIEPDHLTSVWLPRAAPAVAAEVQRFVELVATLRRECPWDREQTHASLRRHLLEESYEVLDAIDHLDVEAGTGFEHLEEELGDLLFQVLFHSQLATEEGWFTLGDVARGVNDKLRLRHPHVFGDVEVSRADDVVANWEQIKKAEKGRDSVFEGIPEALPALLYALKIQKKAATIDGVAPVESPGSSGAELGADDIGPALFALVESARRLGIDPEQALAATARAYRDAARVHEG